jgi:hypothetical protein
VIERLCRKISVSLAKSGRNNSKRLKAADPIVHALDRRDRSYMKSLCEFARISS